MAFLFLFGFASFSKVLGGELCPWSSQDFSVSEPILNEPAKSSSLFFAMSLSPSQQSSS